jgi:hypothetical protein
MSSNGDGDKPNLKDRAFNRRKMLLGGTNAPRSHRTSITHGTIHKAYLGYGDQALAAEFIGTFKDFPPRQKPQSFNLDQIMERLQHPAESD